MPVGELQREKIAVNRTARFSDPQVSSQTVTAGGVEVIGPAPPLDELLQLAVESAIFRPSLKTE